jgi:hypothetical protein
MTMKIEQIVLDRPHVPSLDASTRWCPRREFSKLFLWRGQKSSFSQS